MTLTHSSLFNAKDLQNCIPDIFEIQTAMARFLSLDSIEGGPLQVREPTRTSLLQTLTEDKLRVNHNLRK